MITDALRQIWERVDNMTGPLRKETEAENIARDMREGRFPERSDPILVSINLTEPAMTLDDILIAVANAALEEAAKTLDKRAELLVQDEGSWEPDTNVTNLPEWAEAECEVLEESSRLIRALDPSAIVARVKKASA